jgi:hypothetical protein
MTLQEQNLSALRAAMSNITDTVRDVKVVEGIYIESGIEVPTRAKKLRGMAAVAAKMKVGDSVKLIIPEGSIAGNVAAPLEYQLRKLKRKHTHRVIDGGKAVRIWRV